MQALIVICRSILEHNVRACVDRAKVGFTMIDRVSGRGFGFRCEALVG